MSEIFIKSPFVTKPSPAFSVKGHESKAAREALQQAYSLSKVCSGKLKEKDWEYEISQRIAEENNDMLLPNQVAVPLAALADKRALSTSNASQTIENQVIDFVVPALRAKSANPRRWRYSSSFAERLEFAHTAYRQPRRSWLW